MVRPSETEAPGARRCGQADPNVELRARVGLTASPRGVWAHGRAGIGLSFWRGRASGVRSPFSRKDIPNVTVAYADDRRHEAGGFIAGNASPTYIDAVRKLAAYYRRSPDQLSEEEVRAYILHLRERGAARGTFKANYYGIQYLYRYTVSRDWALFVKKRSVCRDRSGCPARLPTPRSAGCLAA